nr:YfhO family protein [Lachnospiraceae bacterium]
NNDEGNRLRILLPAGFVITALFLLFLLHNPYMSFKRMSVNLFILLLILLLAFPGRKRKYTCYAGILCFAVTFLELAYSSVTSYLAYNADKRPDNLPLLSEFYDEYKTIKEPVDCIKAYDKGIYRIEKDFSRSPNDPMLLDYIGLSHYSSCEKDEVKHFMQRMGFRDTGIYAFYGQGSTAFADCLLGVKYYVSRFDESYKPYMSLQKTGDYYIYINHFSLPFAFSSGRRIRKLDIEENDIFETQNDIASVLSGKEETLYVPALYDRTVTEDEIRYTIHISDRLPLYYYFDTEDSDSIRIFVNGEDKGPYFTDTNWNVYNAGLYDPGTELTVVLSRLGEKFSVTEECFYYENSEAIGEWYESVFKDYRPAEIKMPKSSRISFDIKVPDHSYIILSIPYDKGWQIELDGERVGAEKVLDTLLAIPVGRSGDYKTSEDISGAEASSDIEESGNEHHIEMKYIPEGFFPGIYFSIMGIMMLMADILFYQKRRKL